MLNWLKQKLGLAFKPENYPLLCAWQRERGTSTSHSGETFDPKNPGQGLRAETDPLAQKQDENDDDYLHRLIRIARTK